MKNEFKHMFIDESGDLGFGKGASKFIVISALIVDNPKELERIIKNMRRNIFRVMLSGAKEIKANSSSKALKFHMLNKLNSVKGAKVFHIALEKKKVHNTFFLNEKHKLYDFIAGKLAKNILFDNINFNIKIDKSKGTFFLRKEFNNHFRKMLKKNCKEIRCNIKHSYSHSWAGLQFADILAWSCFQKFEKNNDNYINELNIEQEFYQVWN